MEALVKKLQMELQLKLEAVEPKLSPVKGYDQKVKLLKETIKELKHYLLANPFPDKSTEIRYFKHWLPYFYKLYFYFETLYKLESIRITSNSEEFSKYLEDERKRLTDFFTEQRELYLYYILGSTAEDELLFVRTPIRDSAEFLIRDENVCETSLTLSKLLAYDDYKKIVDEEIALFTEPDNKMNGSKLKFKWKPNKSQTAEVIYSLAKLKCIEVEGQDADIMSVAAVFKESFGVDVTNIYDVHLHNKRRKKDKAPFLHAMLNAYLGTG